MLPNYIKILIFILFFSSLSYGQKPYFGKDRTITLKEFIIDSQVCILYQTRDYTIMTSVNYLKEYFSKRKSSLSSKEKLEVQIFNKLSEFVKGDTLNYYILENKVDGYFHSEEVLADLINLNKCIIEENKSKKKKVNIIVRTFTDVAINSYYRSGSGGENYFVDGKLLFKNQIYSF